MDRVGWGSVGRETFLFGFFADLFDDLGKHNNDIIIDIYYILLIYIIDMYYYNDIILDIIFHVRHNVTPRGWSVSFVRCLLMLVVILQTTLCN